MATGGVLPAPLPGRHTVPRHLPPPVRTSGGEEGSEPELSQPGKIKLSPRCSAQPPPMVSHLLPPVGSTAAGAGSRALPGLRSEG